MAKHPKQPLKQAEKAAEPRPPSQHKGLAVSPGIVIGTVMLLEDDIHRISRRTIPEAQVEGELARFDRAVKESVAELQVVYQTARKEMGDEASKIFLVHIGMLSDKRSFTLPVHAKIQTDQVSAEYAVSQILGALADKFKHSGDSAFATKANDVEDLAQRLLSHLAGRRENRLAHAKPGTVVVASDLTPSQTAGIDRKKILGLATDLGGRTGHTAIVARALNFPAVIGCQTLSAAAREGDTIILDGDRGVVILNPDAQQVAEYKRFIEQRRLFQLSLSDLASLPAVTQDGTKIELHGNIEFPEQAAEVVEAGGVGVGLYRTEYLYLMAQAEPTERDHFLAYKKCVELLKGRPVTIRTMDLGADKISRLRPDIPERNPFLGCRSIRLCLRDQPMFKKQLRAVLRASALGPVKVMFPLVTSMTELRQAKYILNDVMEDLAEDNIPFDKKIQVGMMVEVPAAALMAHAFAHEVDFFSIGTNDLVQYTLAVDRTNERIADLYTPMHPAVIMLIRDIARASRRRETPLSCCGESATDLEYALLLIGLGLRTLSVSSSSIPSLKRLVRSVAIGQCERIAKQAMTFDSEPQVAAYLRDQARKIIPEAFDGRSGDEA